MTSPRQPGGAGAADPRWQQRRAFLVGTAVGARLTSPHANDPGYDRAEARATIERVTSILDDRGREVLRLRFEDDLRQIEIAERVGCSQMHVSRIIRSALDELYVQVSV